MCSLPYISRNPQNPSPMVPRVLIADDQEIVLNRLRKLLESESRYEVCGATLNGVEAVMKAQELHPDLIILDLAMPVMNGLEAARRIGKMQLNIPIVLFTMTDTPQVRVEAAKAGIQQVVDKCAGPRALLSAVQSALGPRVAPAPLESAKAPARPVPLLDPAAGTPRTRQPESPEANPPDILKRRTT
jgi:DNA-binding NarL/FixJ family response regulator